MPAWAGKCFTGRTLPPALPARSGTTTSNPSWSAGYGDALGRLKPGDYPQRLWTIAFRKLTQPEGATLEARNRAFHRLLVDGVTVEYRAGDGAIRGEQARVIDFKDPAPNDWLAVNQFTVTENQKHPSP